MIREMIYIMGCLSLGFVGGLVHSWYHRRWMTKKLAEMARKSDESR